MKKLWCVFTLFLLFLTINAKADSYAIVTASNDSVANQLLVYDMSGSLVQTIPTKGVGGVPPNIVGGGIAKSDPFIAVINYGSQNVSVFKKEGGSFTLLRVIPSISKPVSVAFGYDHIYILGTKTIESHKISGDRIADQPDGSSRLFVGDGSAAQVGVLVNQLIISERSNAIELVDLQDGIVTTNINSVQLPPPPDNNTPVGLVTRGNVAYVTIAHSDKVGMVKNGQLIKVVSSDTQHAPCWLALMGPWLYCSNTPSQSISSYQVSDNTLALSKLIAAQTQGEPTDIDAQDGIVAVLVRGNTLQLTQFQADNKGNLKQLSSTPTAATANGVAIIKMQ